jgi:hypothetical protein
MYVIPTKHVCPRGHEQMGTGYDQVDEIPERDPGPPYCLRCFAEWLGQRFPTAETT